MRSDRSSGQCTTVLKCPHPCLLSRNTLLLRVMCSLLLVPRDGQLVWNLLPLVRPQQAIQLLRQGEVHLEKPSRRLQVWMSRVLSWQVQYQQCHLTSVVCRDSSSINDPIGDSFCIMTI